MSGLAGFFCRAAFVAAVAAGGPALFGAEPGVALALNLRAAFPAPGASQVCADSPLRLTFPATPVAGAGKIQVFDAADDSLVEAIDVGVPTASKAIGGLPNFNYTPVIVADTTAAIYLKNNVLRHGRSYYVTIDAGAFTVGGAPMAGVGKSAGWRFTTKTAPPAPDSRRLTIAADGTGDFCTIQAALDFLPDGNTTPRTLFIRNGVYRELIFWTNKHAITLQGEDRQKTIIAYANNERFNAGGGNPFAGTAPDPSTQPLVGGAIYRRGVLLAHRVNDLTITNLTMRNTTPQGGSQAEAIILNGTPTARAIIRGVDLYSFQDTLQINGQAYLTDCRIEGDVDFLWGTGPCFFENCIARSVRSNTYYTQIRNTAANHGYVFLRCTFEGAPGVTGNMLSRVAPGRFPHSEVVLLDCVLGPSVGPIAWQLDSLARDTPEPVFPNLRFWEFNSRDPEGRPIDTSRRRNASRQLKQPEDAEMIANYRDPAFVLGNGWNPRTAAQK